MIGSVLLAPVIAQREREGGSVRAFIEYNLANFGVICGFNAIAMLVELAWKDIVYKQDAGFVNYFLLLWSLKLF